MTTATLEPMPASGDPTAAPTRAAPVVEVQNLKAYYQVSHYGVVREVRAVDDISLRIESGEIYGLAGESSSGKTTLIKVIAAATRPPLNVVGGTVRFRFGGATVDLYGGAPPDLQALRWKSFSYIMQGSMNVLNPVRRIRHSFVDFAFRHLGQPMPQFMATVGEHLERLHLRPSVLDAYPHELSGGMRQRVTIALATVCRPEFIIADEPTTALDVVVQKGVLAMIREVQLELGSSLLFVTHDMAVHANLCDRLGIMYAGRLVEEGPTARVFREPRHPYTRHLIASLPRIGDTKPREGLKGVPPSLADPPQGCRFHPRCPLAMPVCSERVPPMMPLAHGQGRVACFAATPEAIGKDAG